MPLDSTFTHTGAPVAAAEGDKARLNLTGAQGVIAWLIALNAQGLFAPGAELKDAVPSQFAGSLTLEQRTCRPVELGRRRTLGPAANNRPPSACKVPRSPIN